MGKENRFQKSAADQVIHKLKKHNSNYDKSTSGLFFKLYENLKQLRSML